MNLRSFSRKVSLGYLYLIANSNLINIEEIQPLILPMFIGLTKNAMEISSRVPCKAIDVKKTRRKAQKSNYTKRDYKGLCNQESFPIENRCNFGKA